LWRSAGGDQTCAAVSGTIVGPPSKRKRRAFQAGLLPKRINWDFIIAARMRKSASRDQTCAAVSGTIVGLPSTRKRRAFQAGLLPRRINWEVTYAAKTVNSVLEQVPGCTVTPGGVHTRYSVGLSN